MTADAGGATSATGGTPAAPTGTPSATTNSAPTPPTAPQSDAQAMTARLRASREAAQSTPASVDPTQPQDTVTPGSAGLQAESAESAPDAAPSEPAPDEKASEDSSIPMKAFKERLAREAKKRDELQKQVQERDLAVSRRDTAIELLKAEVNRLSDALQQGNAWDERDEQLRAYEFQDEVRRLQSQLEAEHAERLAEAEQQARFDVRREQVRNFFADTLAEWGDLVSSAELRAACKKQIGDDPEMPVEEIGSAIKEIAARIAGQRLEVAQKRTAAKPETPAPKLVKPGNGTAPSYQYPANAKGMAEWLAARKAARAAT